MIDQKQKGADTLCTMYVYVCVSRDLKPGNVMISEDGTPVVMDLGSATKARVEIKSLREATALQV